MNPLTAVERAPALASFLPPRVILATKPKRFNQAFATSLEFGDGDQNVYGDEAEMTGVSDFIDLATYLPSFAQVQGVPHTFVEFGEHQIYQVSCRLLEAVLAQ